MYWGGGPGRPARQSRAYGKSSRAVRTSRVGNVIAGRTAWLATGDDALVQIDSTLRYPRAACTPCTKRTRLGSGAKNAAKCGRIGRHAGANWRGR